MDNWVIALVCRFFIGVGLAAGFLIVSKIISTWFEPKFYGRMVGITFSLGLIVAVYGGRPINRLIEVFGSENVVAGIGMVECLTVALFVIFVRSNEDYKEEQEM